MMNMGQVTESELLEAAQRILLLAQNFESEYQGLENLKKTATSFLSEDTEMTI